MLRFNYVYGKPSTSTFHCRFSSSLQIVGGLAFAATPFASGPRHWCQLPYFAASNSVADTTDTRAIPRQAISNTEIRNGMNHLAFSGKHLMSVQSIGYATVPSTIQSSTPGAGGRNAWKRPSGPDTIWYISLLLSIPSGVQFPCSCLQPFFSLS